jgi:thiol:disulfide interchange protein
VIDLYNKYRIRLFDFSIVLSLLFHFVLDTVNGEYEGIVFFDGTIEEALNDAHDNNKLVLIDAYANWCIQCIRMEKKVFSSGDAGKFYNEYFISLKIDMEKGKGKDIAKKYDINAYPTLIILKPDGSLHGKHVGYMDRRSFIEFGAKNFKKWQGHSF